VVDKKQQKVIDMAAILKASNGFVAHHLGLFHDDMILVNVDIPFVNQYIHRGDLAAGNKLMEIATIAAAGNFAARMVAYGDDIPERFSFEREGVYTFTREYRNTAGLSASEYHLALQGVACVASTTIARPKHWGAILEIGRALTRGAINNCEVELIADRAKPVMPGGKVIFSMAA
jgi:hypothetical protein